MILNVYIFTSFRGYEDPMVWKVLARSAGKIVNDAWMGISLPKHIDR